MLYFVVTVFVYKLQWFYENKIYCEPLSCGGKVYLYISYEIRMLLFFQMSGLINLENVLYLISFYYSIFKKLQGGHPYWLLKEKPSIHLRSSDPSNINIILCISNNI